MSKPLLIEQESIQFRIKNSYENFTNDENSNLVNSKTRLESLNTLWARYESNYFPIFNLPNASNLNYIKSDAFGQVE